MSRTYTDEQRDDEDDARAAAAAASTPAALTAHFQEKVRAMESGNVTNLAEVRAEKEARSASRAPSGETPNHIRVSGAVLSMIQSRDQEIMFTKQAAYWYRDGLWSMQTDGLAFMLNAEIQKCAEAMSIAPNNKLISEARGLIQRSKALQREHDDIAWDAHGMVATKSGLVDPKTGKLLRPMRPDDYATWRIETEYDEHAKCRWWLQMLEDCFADRSDEERAGTINVIQELLGAGLVDDKPRELSKALIFQGGSNFGKSGLLEVMSGLFGGEVNSTPIEALEGAHGMMPFMKRKPWVLHEAFDQRKWNFSSSVKAIVTGEPIAVNVKNGPMLSIRVNAPIFWGTNHPPAFKESTKAITNRLTVIECKREFFEDKPVGAAKEARLRGLSKPSDLVLRDEMPGLLAWAVAGLKRALKRGRLLPTAAMSDATDEIRKDSNIVAGFLEDCCSYEADYRISVPDFALAFAAWWQATKGEDRSVPSGESVGRAVVAMSDPKIAIDRKALRDTKRRYYAGIILNAEGLSFHQAGYESRDLQGKTANATAPNEKVNERMSEEWLKKPAIQEMRKRQVEDPGAVAILGKDSELIRYL